MAPSSIAPAQGGLHANGRKTYGHSLIVAPWGEVLAEAGTEPGVIVRRDRSGAVGSRRGPKFPACSMTAISRDFTAPDVRGLANRPMPDHP